MDIPHMPVIINHAKNTSEVIENEVGDGDIPELHKAAKVGDCRKLNELLSESITCDEDILQRFRGKTVLHFACEYPKKRRATEMVRSILYCYHLQVYAEVLQTLCDAQDDEFLETALHKAAKRYNREAVIELCKNGADVNILSKLGEEPLTLIYKNVPKAVLAIFDGGITFDEDLDPNDEDLPVIVNLRALVGLHGPMDDKTLLMNETELITTAMKQCSFKGSKILQHPLVKLFLHYKWIKVKYLIWLSMSFHIFWSLLCTAFFVNLYRYNCPYNVTYTRNEIGTCNSGVPNSILGTLVFILCLTVMIKELYEIAISQQIYCYVKQKENIGQWFVVVAVLILSSGTIQRTFSSGATVRQMQEWEYPLAAFGTFVAFALILGQLGKDPKIGFYMEMLATVTQKSFYVLGIYGALLAAFWASFIILLPSRDEFQGFGFVKFVAIMTGESNYDDLFFGENSNAQVPFHAWTQILFFTTTLILTIVLHNLLIGVLVSDIQTLAKNSQLSSIKTQLKEINLMETFLLSKTFQKRVFPKSWLKKILVTQQRENEYDNKSPENSLANESETRIICMCDDNIPSDLLQDIKKYVHGRLRQSKPQGSSMKSE